MKVLKQWVIAVGCASLLGACMHRVPQELTQISGLRAKKSELDINDIRSTAIKETAASLGAQNGLAWRAKQINHILMKHEATLTNIFDFQQLLLKHHVIPPVLATSENIVNVGNDSVIRVAEKMYTILKPPRFSTATPNWQNYLLMHFKAPETPNITLLPKNKAETAVWNKYIVKSWKFGIDQANNIFGANLARLRRQFNGMVLYRQLLAQHMVTAPYVAETTLGITGNQQELRLNDRILRISNASHLITDTSSWQPTLKNVKPNPNEAKP
jgi:defect in organelle trafficking protein DotC